MSESSMMPCYDISLHCGRPGCDGKVEFITSTPTNEWLATLTEGERFAYVRGYARASGQLCPKCRNGFNTEHDRATCEIEMCPRPPTMSAP